MKTTAKNTGVKLATAILLTSTFIASSARAELVLDETASTSEKAAFNQAIDYLSKSSVAREVLQTLHRSTNVYKVVIGARPILSTDEEPGNVYDPATRTVYWIPTYGFQWVTGFNKWQRITPALGLIHELGHAFHQETDPVRHEKDCQDKMLTWDNREEKRTIQEIENEVAKTLNESLRRQHHYTTMKENSGIGFYHTASATTVQAANGTFARLDI